MRFNHVALRVKDIDTMLEFYVGKLSFQEAFRIYNDDQSLRIVYLHISNGQYLELCLGGNTRPHFDDQSDVGVRHMCFTVDDLAATKHELETNGVVFDSEILQMRDQNLAAYVFDPEGNKIELVETQPNSPQAEFERKTIV